MKLQDKVALITSAGSGLDRASAILFASASASIGVADINLESAEETGPEDGRSHSRVVDEPGGRLPTSSAKRRPRAGDYEAYKCAETAVEVTDTMQPGHVALPNGTGLWYPDREGQEFQNGVAPNELTASEHRDWFAGTPFHKHVPPRIERLA